MEGVIEPATSYVMRQPCWQLSQANDSLGSFLGLGLEPGTLFLAHAALRQREYQWVLMTSTLVAIFKIVKVLLPAL